MEAHLAGGEMLGLEGLRDLVQSVSDSHPRKNFEEFGRELVQEFRRKFGEDSDDDETIMVIEFGEGRRMPGIKRDWRAGCNLQNLGVQLHRPSKVGTLHFSAYRILVPACVHARGIRGSRKDLSASYSLLPTA